MNANRWVECAIVRGGTSKGVFFLEDDLPSDREERDSLLLRAFGSPDARQIDGLGGADPLTSKCVIVGRSDEPGVDIRYTFAQVGIDRPHVDYGSVCGNLSSALGHFALWTGLMTADEGVSRARVHVTNVDSWIEVETPVTGGLPRVDGDFAIAGVPGTGAEVVINLAGLAGARLGAVFPTGSRQETLTVDGTDHRVTLMDVGNPHVFLAASSVGLLGTESASALDDDPALLQRLEDIRAAAAQRLGIATSAAAATEETPAAPILGLVAPPSDYTSGTGGQIAASAQDITARLQFMQRTHKNYAGTSTACTGVAVRVAGTVPAEVARLGGSGGSDIRIGHPNGVISTQAVVDGTGDGSVDVRRATVSRTARIIMAGRVAIPA